MEQFQVQPDQYVGKLKETISQLMDDKHLLLCRVEQLEQENSDHMDDAAEWNRRWEEANERLSELEREQMEVDFSYVPKAADPEFEALLREEREIEEASNPWLPTDGDGEPVITPPPLGISPHQVQDVRRSMGLVEEDPTLPPDTTFPLA